MSEAFLQVFAGGIRAPQAVQWRSSCFVLGHVSCRPQGICEASRCQLGSSFSTILSTWSWVCCRLLSTPAKCCRYFPIADSALHALERWNEIIEPSLFVEILPSLEVYMKTTSDVDETADDEKLNAIVKNMQVC